ncbi:MAG: adenylosuccinate synthetase, partial [Synergistaceae bacterium]|nr:adenylosuccinate synthetase [Synergistaceae bacterium]
MVGLKYSMELNGANVIALTKLDVLTGMGDIKVCTAYEHNGQRLTTWPTDIRTLSELTETRPSTEECS